MFSQHPSEFKSNHYDVIISGGEGPGAMIAAYESLMAGKRVLLVSNREEAEFLREQRIYLNIEYRKYLLNMMQKTPTDAADIKMIAELVSATTISLKDLQAFLKRRLQKVAEETGGLNCLFLSTISQINLQEGKVTVSPIKSTETSKVEYTFTAFVGADGANRPSAKVLADGSVPSNPHFTFSEQQLGFPHPNHMTTYFILKRKDKKRITQLPEEDFIIDETRLYKDDEDDDDPDEPNYIWSLSLDKMSLQNSDGQQIKCLFAGEITKELLKIKQYNYDVHSYPFEKAKQESPDEYAKRQKSSDYIKMLGEKRKNEIIEKDVLLHIRSLIYSYFKKKDIDLDDFEMHFHMKGQKKDHLKLTVFNVKISEADQAFLEQNNHYFYLVGDAYETSSYQEGHGLKDTFFAAITFGQVMKSEISNEAYNAECKQNKATPEGRFLLLSLGERLHFSMEELRKEYIVMPYQKPHEAKKQEVTFHVFAPTREPTTLELFAMARNQANLSQINNAVTTYKKIIDVNQKNRGIASFHLSIQGHVEKDLRDLSRRENISHEDKKLILGLLVEIHTTESRYQGDELIVPALEKRHLRKAEKFKELMTTTKNTPSPRY
jgi:hypothetical protein